MSLICSYYLERHYANTLRAWDLLNESNFILLAKICHGSSCVGNKDFREVRRNRFSGELFGCSQSH